MSHSAVTDDKTLPQRATQREWIGLSVLALACLMYRFATLAAGWSRRGYERGVGIGLAVGFATLGRIGFEGRFDYGAVGNVVILASPLSDAAAPGEIILSQRLNASVESSFSTEPLPEKDLKGFSRPVPVFRVPPAQGT